MRGTTTKTSVLSVALLLLASALFAGKKDRELSVQIEGDDGSSIAFSISAGFVNGILEGLAGTDVDCDVSTDDDTRAMLEYLDRRGEGSKYRFRDDDGRRIKASRRRGQLELDIARDGGKDAHVSLPWAAAECMLGRRARLSKEARAELAIEDDGAIHIRIE